MPEILTDKELQELIYLIRIIQWQDEVDTLSASSARSLQKILRKSKTEIIQEIKARAKAKKISNWTQNRLLTLLNELSLLTPSVESKIIAQIESDTIKAEIASLANYNDMLSWGGTVAAFNTVALSSAQIRSVIEKTPVGGLLLKKWVSDIFGDMADDLKKEVGAGMFKGEGYPALVKRIGKKFDFISKTEAITLARTYVQSANITAQQLVYDANKDIVKKVRWVAALEGGNRKTGRGICIRCAVLDGQVFPVEEHPDCPLHPRCRCTLVPMTVSWKSLGLSTDEIADVKRPYTIRGRTDPRGNVVSSTLNNLNIDEGGKRQIIEAGFHDGDYEKWMKTRNAKFQENLLGAKRYELMKSGKVKWEDLVDKDGNLRLLKDLI